MKSLSAPIAAVLASLAVAVALVPGCGAGEGTERLLPPGPQTAAPPGDRVIYVSEGQGNRVAAYRLGTDGLLPATPFSTVDIENPRRLLLRGSILYICFRNGVASVQLEADGGFPSAVTATTTPIDGVSAIDMELVGDVLYVALEALRVVAAYPLDQGHVPPDALSLSGTNLSDYHAMAARGPIIYAAAISSARVDSYLINEDGSLDEDPIPQVPQTLVGLSQDLVIVGDNLYISDGDRRRIYQYEILDTGLLPEDPLTETTRNEFYARLIIHEGVIYASGFNIGRVDLFGIDSDSGEIVSETPFYSTFQDVAAFPNGMLIANGILYVTQSGRARVDAYILGVDGVPSSFPSSSTVDIVGSFPNDVLIGTFPP